MPKHIMERISNNEMKFELPVGKIYLFHAKKVHGSFFIIYGTDITDTKTKQILQKLSKYFSPQVSRYVFIAN